MASSGTALAAKRRCQLESSPQRPAAFPDRSRCRLSDRRQRNNYRNSGKPAFAFISVRVRSSLPDFCGAKVRSIWIRITYPLHHAQMAFVKERFQSRKFAIQSHMGIELQNLVCRETELGP